MRLRVVFYSWADASNWSKRVKLCVLVLQVRWMTLIDADNVISNSNNLEALTNPTFKAQIFDFGYSWKHWVQKRPRNRAWGIINHSALYALHAYDGIDFMQECRSSNMMIMNVNNAMTYTPAGRYREVITIQWMILSVFSSLHVLC